MNDSIAEFLANRWVRTAAAPVATIIMFAIFLWLAFPPRPAIIDNLPTTAPEIAATWAERMHARFPVGSPIADLNAQLTDWGFIMPAPLHYRIELASAPCSDFFEVTWTADTAGNLITLDPTHRQTCRP